MLSVFVLTDLPSSIERIDPERQTPDVSGIFKALFLSSFILVVLIYRMENLFCGCVFSGI